MPKGSNKKGKPAQCNLCGQTRQEYVVLLVNPDPVKHEIWCDDCYVKEVRNEQSKQDPWAKLIGKQGGKK